MSEIVYTLCAVTSALCAGLLLKAYSQSRFRLLLWGGLCFAGLTLTNVLLVVDKLVVPETDLSVLRLLLGLISLMVFLAGLILEGER
ncbi:DUF5985 family protein [Rhizobacter sp. J219]|jgi:hypothetical protein|uniref:DUF5985 family protein n=1 Tax=Rhizobacter sp. J219 TaxID=2898430 RepID=UPI002150D9F4|nr:DUF5985 family protein [Rhizobacter sp. J219]MCR5882864.1 DUF5985 family protein [Rhizobacter sp. J219]